MISMVDYSIRDIAGKIRATSDHIRVPNIRHSQNTLNAIADELEDLSYFVSELIEEADRHQ